MFVCINCLLWCRIGVNFLLCVDWCCLSRCVEVSSFCNTFDAINTRCVCIELIVCESML